MSRPSRDSGKYVNEESRLAYNALLACSHIKADQWPTEILSTKDGGDRYLDWTCSPMGLRNLAERIRNGELALDSTRKNGSMPDDKVIGVCEICGLTVVKRPDGTRAHIGWTRPEETWHDSYTVEDRQREFEHFLAEQEEAERKALEIKERQARARELPSNGIVHTLKVAGERTAERIQPKKWWRRMFE